MLVWCNVGLFASINGASITGTRTSVGGRGGELCIKAGMEWKGREWNRKRNRIVPIADPTLGLGLGKGLEILLHFQFSPFHYTFPKCPQ